MTDRYSSLWQSRRQFLGAGMGLLALSALAPFSLLGKVLPPPQNAISPDDALRRLLDGNARYASNSLDPKDFSMGRAARAKAQYPIAAILSCADSRVAPELIFDQGPGDLFVVRVAGNYLSRDSLASLEYAVAILKVPLIMVLGHSDCGAIKAAVGALKQPTPLPGHIWDIVDAVRPGIEKSVAAGGNDAIEHAIEANVDYNVMRIDSAQPIIAQAASSHQIRVVGAVYDLSTGKVAMRSTA